MRRLPDGPTTGEQQSFAASPPYGLSLLSRPDLPLSREADLACCLSCLMEGGFLMRIHTAPNHQLPCITVDYHLMMSSTSPDLFLGDEPIALCRVRLAQAVPIGGEECQLVAWHFAAGEMPIAMPIEETCECVEGEWTGR